MRKILSILFLILICTCSVSGQKINYNLKASLNYPYIATIEETPETINLSPGYTSSNLGYLQERYSEKISGKVSGTILYQITNRLFIEGGLQLNLIRFQQTTYVKGIYGLDEIRLSNLYTEEGSPYGVIYGGVFSTDSLGDYIWQLSPTPNLPENYNDLGKSSILYTEIPIQIGYSFLNHKLNCKLGITTSFLAYSEVYTYNTDQFSTYISKNTSSDGFKNLIWNGNIEVEYLVYKNIGINLNYSRSLNSIYDDNASIGSPKYNIFSLGLSYSFLHNTN